MGENIFYSITQMFIIMKPFYQVVSYVTHDKRMHFFKEQQY